MDTQSLFNAGFVVASTIAGWFARELWSAVKELKTDLSKLSADIPKTYVTRDDYREDLKEIRDLLAKIFDKLDNKADK
jgi:hypothetical protein